MRMRVRDKLAKVLAKGGAWQTHPQGSWLQPMALDLPSFLAVRQPALRRTWTGSRTESRLTKFGFRESSGSCRTDVLRWQHHFGTA